MKSLYKHFVVFIPSPFWTETKVNVETNGGTVVPYSYKELDDLLVGDIGVDDLITRKLNIKVFNKKPNIAILINSPHNPTGEILQKHHIDYLTQLTEKWNMTLISDEAYEHILYDGYKHISPKGDHVVNIYSCSKSYGMAGLRVGYVHTKKEDLYRAINKEVRCTINGVNSISQYGAQVVLEDGVQEYIKNCVDAYNYRRSMLFDALHKSPYFQIDEMPQGAFYLWAKVIADKTDWEMTSLLLEQGVGSAPSDVFTIDQSDYHLRFSYACSDEDVEFACNVIRGLKI
jgi:aspartate aminotransferase